MARKTAPNPPTNDIQAHYSRVAPLYDILDWPFEWARYRPLRRRLCRDVGHSVLEAGVGTGRNLGYYPPGAHVTGIDLSPAMLARAQRRALPPGVTARLHTGDVTATGFATGELDTVVASFLLCVLPQALRLPALIELARVCRPDGRIRLIEYQRSRRRWRRDVQALWAPYVRWAFGADFDLDLDDLVARAGVHCVSSELLVGDVIRLVVLQPGHARPTDRGASTASG